VNVVESKRTQTKAKKGESVQRETARTVGVVFAVGAASGLLLRLSWLPGLRVSSLGPLVTTGSPQQSLPLLLSLVLCAFSCWLAATVAISCAGQLPGAAGRRARAALRRVAPVAVRRGLEVALGLSTVLATGAGAANAAGPAAPAPAAQQVTSTASALTTLDRPVTGAPAPAEQPVTSLDRPAAHTAGARTDPARGLGLVTAVPTRVPAAQAISVASAPSVTARDGDSLWRIAARALPQGSSPNAIERAWHRWYHANRTLIGPDPGLLHPGEHLTAP
jgi:resuscitation-promoting factor RpfA